MVKYSYHLPLQPEVSLMDDVKVDLPYVSMEVDQSIKNHSNIKHVHWRHQKPVMWDDSFLLMEQVKNFSR
jgi:hypothetical protein